MSTIAHNLQAVHDRIATAARAVQRAPNSITLLAVSKTFGPNAVLEAVTAGQLAFGENYVQEALDKMASIHAAKPASQIQWHFIGPIQSNKTRQIAEHFDWVHTVDRLKIAQRLSDQRPVTLAPLNICLQVNISGESSKSGIPPQDLWELAQAVVGMPRLKLRGLMAIPEPTEDTGKQRAAFHQMRELQEQCNARGMQLDTLSMGMSGDMEAAIAEGATMVRVGTAIFGHR
jgi:pyridoxal phosphate enzyme (YggS family)